MQANAGAAVGVFDSGLGGLSVMLEIRQLLPSEQLIYVADSAYVPYGEKDTATIIKRSMLIGEFLFGLGIKALVVACNTATAAAIASLRERWPEQIVVGMEPAIKPAVSQTSSGKIGVLATTGTLRSARFEDLLQRYGALVEVITQPCPGLVELIEAGELDTVQTIAMLHQYVDPLLAAGCDRLILGCTHYPFIKPVLQKMVPPQVAIIDTGSAVAKRVEQLLASEKLLASGTAAADVFYTTGAVAAMQSALPGLWPQPATAQQLQL